MQRASNQAFVGVILIVLGAVWLANNLGIGNVGSLTRWIPSLFILLGIWQLVNSQMRFITGPLVLIGGGFLWQLAALDIIGLWQLWPVILIAIGVSILVNNSQPGRSLGLGSTDDRDWVNLLGIFSNPEAANTSTAFRGGEITGVFGNATLDLRRAEIGERPATINILGLFGSASLVIPEDWAVDFNVLAILGGVQDQRVEPVISEEAPDLRLTGFVMFGNVQIKAGPAEKENGAETVALDQTLEKQ
jgi:predicted membrane protein